jgi:long-chain fatty acid transport protein
MMAQHGGTLRFLLIGVAGALTLPTLTSTAAASGFAIRENSAAAIGTAFAGSGSLAEDASTIFSNPAGMTRLSGNRGEVAGTVILPSIQFKGSGRSLGGAVPSGGSNEADAGRTAVVPAAYALMDLSPDWKAGLAVTAPFGLTTEYPSDWAGRYLGLDTKLATINVNPNIAYRVNRWLSIAAGVSAQHLDADLSLAINSSALVPAGLGGPLPPNSPGFPDGLARLTGSDWGWGYNFGALLEPAPGTRIGLTYRSRVRHNVEGNVNFSMPAALAASFPNSPIKSSITVPDSATLSLTHALGPHLTIVSDIEWTGWSSFKTLSVTRSSGASVLSTPENFRDTYFVSLGVIYRPDDRWSYRAGIAYDQSPVRDLYRTVRLPDGDRRILGLGLGYRLGDAFRLDVGYAHYFIPHADISQSVNSTSATKDVLTGGYRLSADEISLSARLRF